MPIAIVAFPDLSHENYQWIDKLRQKYSELAYEPLNPHFTLVFPITDAISRKKTIKHVDRIEKQTKSIQFKIRCAVPSPDWISKRNYVFLVPDEGFSELIRLHDALYTNIFEPYLSRRISFIPHITIGHCDVPQLARKISLEINEENIEFTGAINQLDLLDNADGEWKTIQTFKLVP